MKRNCLLRWIADECEATLQDMLGDPDNYGVDDTEKVDGVLLDDLDWKEVGRDVAEVLTKRFK